MSPRARFILREACIGAVLNAMLSYGVFWLLFRGASRIPVRGFGNFLFDFLPQGFMVALMSAFVPGLLARRAIARGQFPGTQTAFAMLPRALPAKAVVLGLAAVVVLSLPMIGVVAAFGGEMIDWTTASALKMAFGAGVSLAITPISLCSIIPAR